MIGLALALALAGTRQSGSIAEDSMIASRGSCTAQSHTASGPADTDLTKRQKPFRCSTMVTSMVDNQPGHFMFSFAGMDDPIAFAGFIVARDVFRIDRVYFTPGRPTAVDDGECRVFRAGREITSVLCGAMVVESGWKTAAVISFQDGGGEAHVHP